MDDNNPNPHATNTDRFNITGTHQGAETLQYLIRWAANVDSHICPKLDQSLRDERLMCNDSEDTQPSSECFSGPSNCTVHGSCAVVVSVVS